MLNIIKTFKMIKEDTTNLSKVVWDRIKADLSISKFYTPKDSNIETLQAKVNELLESIPFEEDEVLESLDKELVARWAKDLKLPILDDPSHGIEGDARAEEISMISKEELNKWSDEAYELAILLIKLNFLPQICNELYIRYFFRSFKFDTSKITTIDEGFPSFASLTILSLSHNRITVLQNLPPKLVELNVYDNLVENIQGPPLNSLRHLGIGYNKLSDNGLSIKLSS